APPAQRPKCHRSDARLREQPHSLSCPPQCERASKADGFVCSCLIECGSRKARFKKSGMSRITRKWSNLLASQRLNNVHARRACGGQERCDGGSGEQSDDRTSDRQKSGKLDLLDITGKHPRKDKTADGADRNSDGD